MKLIIDGYNLIRSITHPTSLKLRRASKQTTEPDVQQMLGRLRRYQRATKHEIIVVFDGGDSMHRYQTGYHGLTLWYSGIRETADDLIRMLLSSVHPESTLLISDDRQLNEVAQERDIVSVSPLFFIARLAEREGIKPTKQHSHGLTKTSEDADDELDVLMQAYSGSVSQKKDHEQSEMREPKHKKSSKLERRLEALIRKL